MKALQINECRATIVSYAVANFILVVESYQIAFECHDSEETMIFFCAQALNGRLIFNFIYVFIFQKGKGGK